VGSRYRIGTKDSIYKHFITISPTAESVQFSTLRTTRAHNLKILCSTVVFKSKLSIILEVYRTKYFSHFKRNYTVLSKSLHEIKKVKDTLEIKKKYSVQRKSTEVDTNNYCIQNVLTYDVSNVIFASTLRCTLMHCMMLACVIRLSLSF
jgi:outer membrane lipoprotein-sorting protein